MTEATPNEWLDALLTHVIAAHTDTFIVSGSLEDPEPVSVNKLYTTYRGKQYLNKQGEAYKDALTTVVARSSFEWKRAHDIVYQEGGKGLLLLALYFKSLVNKSWKPNRKTEKGTPSSPLKKQDVDNYIKIVSDAVSAGCGIDDSNNITVLVTKAEDSVRPRTEFIYIVIP